MVIARPHSQRVAPLTGTAPAISCVTSKWVDYIPFSGLLRVFDT